MRRRLGTRTALGLIPPILLIIGMLLPAVNGPHLWLGLPSLMWWLAGFAVSVTVALALIEKLHPESGDSE
ncbi:MAG TPA: hypothetical protein VG756_26615 [Pseudonocardiaceae bacterium]|jgi:hypothetical protein|nr:hypothetical protein [Pseudonocardiaceae bacterium]